MPLELQAKLKKLSQNLTVCQSVFEELHARISTVNRLENNFIQTYDHAVLTWVSSWVERFLLQFPEEDSVFASINDETLSMIIERKRNELLLYIKAHQKFLLRAFNDFTVCARLPARGALLSALELVKKPNESACQLLMPHVKRIVGSVDPEDVGCSTTDVLSGKFNAWQFLACDNRDTLISLVDLFGLVESSVDARKQFFQDPEQRAYRKRIERHFQNPAVNYIRVLEYFDKQSENTDNFVFYVIQLATALHKSSERQDGNSAVAGDVCIDFILNFHRIWNSLSQSVRNEVGNTRIEGFQHTFGQVVILLFQLLFQSGVPIQLTQEEKDEKNVPTLHCAAYLSGWLYEFVNANAYSWQSISIRSDGCDALYTKEDLSELREVFYEAVNTLDRCYRIDSMMWEAIHLLCNSTETAKRSEHEHFVRLSSCFFEIPYSDLQRHIEDKFISGADQLIRYLQNTTNDSEHRLRLWRCFEPLWKPRLNGYQFIILQYLCDKSDLFDDRSCFDKRLADVFKCMMNGWGKKKLKEICVQYEVSFNLVFQFFIHSLMRNRIMPDESVNAILTCVQAFDPNDWEEDFEQLCQLQPLIFVPSVASFQAMIDMLMKSKESFALNADALCYALLQRCLPKLVFHEVISSLWNPESGCCVNFWSSSEKSADNRCYQDLLDVSGDDFDVAMQRIEILKAFIEKGVGHQFLVAVKAHFPSQFIEMVQDIYSHQVQVRLYHEV